MIRLTLITINNITINKAEYERNTLHVKPFLPHKKNA